MTNEVATMQTLLQLMKQYNKLIESYQRADTYFASQDVPLEEKQTRGGDIIKLFKKIDTTSKEIASHGYIMTSEENLQGFRQVKYLNL